MVDYGIHAYIGAVKYIFISKICVIVLFVQIPELCREVTIENDIFVSFGMFSESDVSITTTIFTFRKELMVYYQRQGHICFFRRMEFIFRM